VNVADKNRLVELASRPGEFISRLKIVDEKGQERLFNHPFAEQVAALEDFQSDAQTVIHYKPRQIGDTTVATAYNFNYLYWATDPARCLVVADSYDSTDAIFGRVRHYYRSLPQMLKKPIERSNKRELIFKDSMAGFRCMTAGGKSDARGWTYQRLHADELAFWPNAEDVWASVTSTLHEGPHKKIIIISTADGPGNLFHSKVLSALEAQRRGDPSVRFRFFKWSDHLAYKSNVPSGWEPDQEEYELAQTHNLTMQQLYWRHDKIHGVEGVGIRRFRREYPLTIEDGFAMHDGSWFDADYLNTIVSSLKPVTSELRIYERPYPGLNYSVGVDPAWCNGGDFATVQVLSADGRQVAVFSTNQGGEVLFAKKAAELAMYYNKARSIIEANTGGAGPVVIREFQKTGLPLWHRPPEPGRPASKTLKFWTTTRGSKEEGYAHLRQMVNSDVLTLNDMTTVQELMHIREKNGKIEGQDGYHDDHADALMLAEWGRRKMPQAKELPKRGVKKYYARNNPFNVLSGSKAQ
tara:strand:- start:2915 stop:4483 length:1569 start_codon:yes stop_codon:yes gene_type:complete